MSERERERGPPVAVWKGSRIMVDGGSCGDLVREERREWPPDQKGQPSQVRRAS